MILQISQNAQKVSGEIQFVQFRFDSVVKEEIKSHLTLSVKEKQANNCLLLDPFDDDTDNFISQLIPVWKWREAPSPNINMMTWLQSCEHLEHKKII